MGRPLVVFDLDGTLVDSAPHCALILNAMLEARGHPGLSEAEVLPHVTAGGVAMIEALLGARCGESAAALSEFRARYGDLPTPSRCLYPGAREALRALADQGATLAVWSNKPQGLCDKVVGDLGLSSLFVAVVGTGPAIPLKPNTAGFDTVLRRTGGERRRCCLVGDTAHDQAAAAAAGVPFVMVAHGYGAFDQNWPGARLVDGFDALPDAIASIFAMAGSAS